MPNILYHDDKEERWYIDGPEQLIGTGIISYSKEKGLHYVDDPLPLWTAPASCLMIAGLTVGIVLFLNSVLK